MKARSRKRRPPVRQAVCARKAAPNQYAQLARQPCTGLAASCRLPASTLQQCRGCASIKGCLLCYEKRKAAVLSRATPRRPRRTAHGPPRRGARRKAAAAVLPRATPRRARPRRSTRGPPPTPSHNVKVAPPPYSMRLDRGGFPQ